MFYSNYVKLCSKINKSPSAVGEELGFTRASVTGWGNGATPRKSSLIKIADYFGITVEALMGDKLPVLPPEGAKKAPATKGEGYDDKITRLYTQLPKLSDRQREIILGIVDEMLKNGEA